MLIESSDRYNKTQSLESNHDYDEREVNSVIAKSVLMQLCDMSNNIYNLTTALLKSNRNPVIGFTTFFFQMSIDAFLNTGFAIYTTATLTGWIYNTYHKNILWCQYSIKFLVFFPNLNNSRITFFRIEIPEWYFYFFFLLKNIQRSNNSRFALFPTSFLTFLVCFAVDQ